MITYNLNFTGILYFPNRPIVIELMNKIIYT